MKLIVLHFHFDVGGVRRVIQSAVPFILKEMPGIERVVLAGGSACDLQWNRAFLKSVAPVPAEIFTDSAFGYIATQQESRDLVTRLRAALARLLGTEEPVLVWAHNLSIARNLPLAREIARTCSARKITLVAHHHDWWFDNRWVRWPEMKRTGFRDLNTVAKTLFPKGPHVRFATINRADATLLRPHFGPRVAWLPNPADRAVKPTPKRLHTVRGWLRERLDSDAPVWLMPCRVLRRKNIAEALLLTRWLRPEAVLATTGSASSADEETYTDQLRVAAKKHRWPLHLGILEGLNGGRPAVSELLAASECVLLTSLQEGFGLTYLEAAAAGRPLITRRLANIAPDLHRFGFRFPYSYCEILVAPESYDWKAERQRQRVLFSKWKQSLPRTCRSWAEPPSLLLSPVPLPIPFSRLTLPAQLEVLALTPHVSWEQCHRLNPFLDPWKLAATSASLKPMQWPNGADDWLSVEAYAKRFAKLVRINPHRLSEEGTSIAAHEHSVRGKLTTPHLYPLLFAR